MIVHCGLYRKVPKVELPLFSPHGVIDSVTAMTLMCDNTYEVIANQGSSLELSCPEFFVSIC